ncbi:type II toxin-antitoxin system VapB family antitoxin [Psychrobacter arenosus]|uniref:type II toxin-antitoxin system VapB family antitoxin n=1 Tax=Psychrobacter arenosus TaxID=256326 RepID=UPI00191934A8|nr:type II toxin-antitoxin system VapB family antitoxin [Psychrobacter arenosus]
MRTNIVIDDELMSKAQQISGNTTKKDTVDEALRLLVRMKAQEELRKLRGKLQWDGDLDDMRSNVQFISDLDNTGPVDKEHI